MIIDDATPVGRVTFENVRTFAGESVGGYKTGGTPAERVTPLRGVATKVLTFTAIVVTMVEFAGPPLQETSISAMRSARLSIRIRVGGAATV